MESSPSFRTKALPPKMSWGEEAANRSPRVTILHLGREQELRVFEVRRAGRVRTGAHRPQASHPQTGGNGYEPQLPRREAGGPQIEGVERSLRVMHLGPFV